MASCGSSIVMAPPMEIKKGTNAGFLIFDSSKLSKQEKLPKEFIWPAQELVQAKDELNEPLIDLDGFFKGDEAAIAHAAKLVRKACLIHGFFQVTNHGVDPDLLRAAEDQMDPFFNLPMSRKLSIQKRPGEMWGYCGAHADRFSSKLPWKEMISFGYHYKGHSEPEVANYFKNALGDDFKETGWVYQRYCEAMKELSLRLLRLLAISLELEDTSYYEKFYEDGVSLLRCNYYPTCQEYGLTLGTGPHCDPTSLTILHQDQVGGLEVFTNNKWHSVKPQPGALVINIGETLMALTNGKYKSCLHRAVVNSDKDRKSLAYFLNPIEHKVVKPPEYLVAKEGSRKYPDFTWSEFLGFTQHHYRSDGNTLNCFVEWLLSAKTQ